MERDVVTMRPDDGVETLLRAQRALREHEIAGVPVVDGGQRVVGIVDRLPVVEDGEPVGVVTRLDVLEAVVG